MRLKSVEHKREQLAFVADFSHDKGKALGGEGSDVRLLGLVKKRRIQLVHILKVLEHVSPQELEQIGETLEDPLEHFGVLRLKQSN